MWGIVARNVAALTKPPRRRIQEPQLLRRDQPGDLLDAARASWLYPFVHLAIATGLRRGEILGLHWSDIDWAAKTLRVSRIVSFAGGKVVVAEPKTKGSRRLITLPADTLAVLREHRASCRGELIFPNPSGSYRNPAGLAGSWSRLLEAAGLPHVKFHSLRHLHATLLLEAGVNPKVVSERLGHTGIGVTLDLYSHVTAPLQQHAAETIGQAMSGLHKQ